MQRGSPSGVHLSGSHMAQSGLYLLYRYYGVPGTHILFFGILVGASSYTRPCRLICRLRDAPAAEAPGRYMLPEDRPVMMASGRCPACPGHV